MTTEEIIAALSTKYYSACIHQGSFWLVVVIATPGGRQTSGFHAEFSVAATRALSQ